MPGIGTLPDELLRLAGFANASADYGLKNWDILPLEYLVANPPRVLLSIGESEAGRDRLMAHPAVRRLATRIRIEPFPRPAGQLRRTHLDRGDDQAEGRTAGGGTLSRLGQATLWLLLAALAAAALSVAAGKVWVPPGAWTAADPRSIIIVELRLPRTVLALTVGAALGLSGAVMQGYLRNPLADPGLFGVSSGAALGAVVALYFGYAAQAWLLPGFALAGAGATMGLLALIAGRSGSLILFTLARPDPDQHRGIAHRAGHQPGSHALRVGGDRDLVDGRADRPQLGGRLGGTAAGHRRGGGAGDRRPVAGRADPWESRRRSPWASTPGGCNWRWSSAPR